MKILLVRHGETIQNRSGIIQGQQQGELSPLGLEQRLKLAERLQNEAFNHIYCSDLARTKDTLAPLLPYQQETPVTYLTEIRERHFGVLEGSTWSAYSDFARKQNADRLSFRPPEGENFHDLQARTDLFLNNTIAAHPDDSILVISHGGAIRTMIAHLLTLPLNELLQSEIQNTSISEFLIETHESSQESITPEKSFTVTSHSINDHKHLNGLELKESKKYPC